MRVYHAGSCIYNFLAHKRHTVRNRTSCVNTIAKELPVVIEDSQLAVLPEDNLSDTLLEDTLQAVLPEHSHCESLYFQ